MNEVDPLAGKIAKRGEVFLGGQNLRLEAPHPTGRGSLFGDGMAADDLRWSHFVGQFGGEVKVYSSA